MASSTPESILEKLKATLALVEVLKKENETYKDNFDQLTINYENVETKLEKLGKEYQIVLNEKESLTNDLEEQKEKLKRKLAEKEQEYLAQLKKPILQKDYELLKINIQQDIERQQKQKFDIMEKETVKFRNLYYKIKREYESNQNECELKLSNMQRTMREQEQAHETAIANMKSKIAMLQDDSEDTINLERLRTTQREKTELELRVKSLLQELDQLRAEKEDLRLLSEQEERNHKRQLAEYIAASKGFHSEKESLQARCNAMEEEMRLLLRKQDDTKEDCNRLRKELDKNLNIIEENAHRYNMETSELKMQLIKEKTDHQNIVQEHKLKMTGLNSEIAANNELIAELRDKISNIEKESLEKIALVREEDWSKISLLESEKNELEKQLNSLKQRSVEMENRNDLIRKELDNECSRIKKQAVDLNATIEVLESTNRSLLMDKEQASINIEQLRKRIDEKSVQLNNHATKIDSLSRQLSTTNEKLDAVEVEKKALQEQFENIQEQLHREGEAYEHTIERQKLFHSKEKQALNQQIESITREKLLLLEKLETMENVLDKQQQLFESKIIQLKDKLKIFKTESNELKKLIENQRNEAVSDKIVGSTMMFISFIVFTYYSTWVFIVPFLTPDHYLHSLFLPYEWAIRIPVLLLVIGIALIGGFVSYVLSKSAKSKKQS
ncbi:Centrosomal protein of 83 kDa [Boothiomyces macroporosus]|uniref:Centrosomal protein of 83 kDa n=1 Tax=Boothiomyces macroporosus TaxID=261099 RepID=A0AAD5UI00_9FUNG|nr:Centrosomal protein of 83 kDa [Boothiomyces macroporosus]